MFNCSASCILCHLDPWQACSTATSNIGTNQARLQQREHTSANRTVLWKHYTATVQYQYIGLHLHVRPPTATLSSHFLSAMCCRRSCTISTNAYLYFTPTAMTLNITSNKNSQCAVYNQGYYFYGVCSHVFHSMPNAHPRMHACSINLTREGPTLTTTSRKW